MLKAKSGYTLIEILVSLGLIFLVSLIALPFSLRQISQSKVEATASQMSSNLFFYQQEAFGGKNDKSYGFKFSSSGYTLFIGNTFATAETVDPIDFPSEIDITNINLSGGSDEIVFSAGELIPSASGTLRLSDGVAIYDVTINQEGFIDFTKIE